MIIIALKDINFAEPNDFILILDEGVSVEYGKYKDLAKNADSRITKFLKLNKTKDSKKNVIGQFQRGVQRAISMNKVFDKLTNELKDDVESVRESVKSSARSIEKFNNVLQKKLELMKQERNRKQFTFLKFLHIFLTAAAPSETYLICKYRIT